VSPKNHLTISFIAGIFMLNLFRWTDTEFLIFLASSLLIDIDHLLYFLSKRKGVSETIALWKAHYRKKVPGIYVFHSIEFIIALAVASIAYRPALFVLLGVLVHLGSDAFLYIMHYKNLRWLRHWCLLCQLRR